MDTLNVALAKGRLAEWSMDFFRRSGVTCREFENPERKLILLDDQKQVRFFLSKPSDVPTYVEYGAADIGIVGKDTLLEEDRNLYEVLDLGFGACKICVAGLPAMRERLPLIQRKTVATKYPRIAQRYFREQKKERVEIIKINGSIELAPLVGLADVIVDMVQSGSTLQANGLFVL